jgi:hypothetical protein
MIRLLLTRLLLPLCFVVYFVQPVSAHILETDGSLGAVLHINPDDDPIAKVQAVFFLEFKQKNGQFNPQNYACVVSITQDEQVIYSQNLFDMSSSPDSSGFSFSYVFPKKALYKLVVSGIPVAGESPPFTLIYDIRVEREQEAVRTKSPPWGSRYLVLATLLAVAALIILGLAIRKIAKKNRGGN